MKNTKKQLIAALFGALIGASFTIIWVSSHEDDELEIRLQAQTQAKGLVARTTAKREIPQRPRPITSKPAAKPTEKLVVAVPASQASQESKTMPRIDTQAQCCVSGYLYDENGDLCPNEDVLWTATFGPQTLRGSTQTGIGGRLMILLVGPLQLGEIGRLRIIRGRINFRSLVPDPIPKSAVTLNLPLALPIGEYKLGAIHFVPLP